MQIRSPFEPVLLIGSLVALARPSEASLAVLRMVAKIDEEWWNRQLVVLQGQAQAQTALLDRVFGELREVVERSRRRRGRRPIPL